MDKERIDGFRSAFALEFMRFLQGQGIRVPEDVQIIGFDDTLASRESVPALTTIHQDAALRARTAIRRLEALRDGTPCDAGILIAQFLGAEEHTEAFSYLPMAVSTVLSAWLRCKEHAAVPF
uniref:substrate-binding domain-containing protein n=1 Tax=Faecalibacterium sp. TaxID=1971605 RepID=UPI003FEE61E6